MTLEKALKLLSLPREVARHPTSGEPIVAGIGRYGSYVQHGKTYANLGKDDDVLEIGGNRAIDLIVAKESGAGRRGSAAAARAACSATTPKAARCRSRPGGSAPTSITARSTPRCRRATNPDELTLEEALEALKAKAAGVVPRRAADRRASRGRRRSTCWPGGSAPYVKWGKVNATIPKSHVAGHRSRLQDAIELIAEREGKPAKPAQARRRPSPESGGEAKAAAKPSAKPAAKPAAKAAPAKGARQAA